MDKFKAYKATIATFPACPPLSRNTTPLSASAPPPEYLAASAKKFLPSDHLVHLGKICRLLIPIDQLAPHRKQRDLDVGHARTICDSFDGNPATLMLSHPGVAILENPHLFPSTIPNREHVYRVDNRMLRFTILNGQHRQHALKLFCEQHSVQEASVYWVFDILHPILASDPSAIDRIMLHENIVLPQAGNTLPWEFSTLINLFHTHYARNDDRPFPNQDRTVAGIDSTRQITTSKFKFVGGDRNSRHMLHRILGCRYIVEALYLTRLGLTGGTQPQSTQFYDHGSAYEMWWKDPMALIEFIYVLRCLNIGPLAAACIYAQAGIIKRINEDLSLTLELKHFSQAPIRIEQPDIQVIIKEVSQSFNAPLLLMYPRLLSNIPSFLSNAFLPYINTMRALNIICLGVHSFSVSTYTPKTTDLDCPMEPRHCLFDSLSQKKLPEDRKRINTQIMALINATSVEIFSALERQFPKNGFKRPSAAEFYPKLMELLRTSHEWYTLVLSTEMVAADGMLFYSPDHVMPKNPPHQIAVRSHARDEERAEIQRSLDDIEEQSSHSRSEITRIEKKNTQLADALVIRAQQLFTESEEYQRQKREADDKAAELERQAQVEKDLSMQSENRVIHMHDKIKSLVEKETSIRESIPVLTTPLHKKYDRLQQQKQKLVSEFYQLDQPLMRPEPHLIPLPNPLNISSRPDSAETLLNTDVLESFSIPIRPLANLIDTYLSLSPSQRDTFSNPSQCAAFTEWASGSGNAPSTAKRPRCYEERDLDSDEETAAESSPPHTRPKKARLYSHSPRSPSADASPIDREEPRHFSSSPPEVDHHCASPLPFDLSILPPAFINALQLQTDKADQDSLSLQRTFDEFINPEQIETE